MIELSAKVTGDKLTAKEWDNHSKEKENAVTKANLPLGLEEVMLFNAIDKVAKFNIYMTTVNALATEYTATDRHLVQNTPMTNGLTIGFVVTKTNAHKAQLNYNVEGLRPLKVGGIDIIANSLVAGGFYKAQYLNDSWNLIQDEILPQTENRLRFGTSQPYPIWHLNDYKNEHFKKIASVIVRNLTIDLSLAGNDGTAIGDSDRRGYDGAVFDGRFVYHVPLYNGHGGGWHGKMCVLDTVDNHIRGIDLEAINSQLTGFKGGCYNGENVYLAPYNNSVTAIVPTANINDTNNGVIGVNIGNVNVSKFDGCTTDGRFVYYAPILKSDNTLSSECAILDTVDNSVTYRDISGGNPNAKGFRGAFFADKKVIFCPADDFTTGLSQQCISIWDLTTDTISIIDIPLVTGIANAKGYSGGVTDGKYVYLSPLDINNVYMVKLNVSDFNDLTLIDLSLGDANYKGYWGAIFDGRYIYFTPWSSDNLTYHGYMSVYDTVGGGVTHQDLTESGAGAKGFIGGCFDGKTVHLTPTRWGTGALDWSQYSVQITALNKRFV